MKRKYNIIYVLAVILIFNSFARAWNVSNPMCEEIEKSVKKTFPKSKLKYKSIFETSCKFEWDFKDKGNFKKKEEVTLHFFKDGSDKLARESITDFIEGVEREANYTKVKYSQPKHIIDDFWDDFYLYKSGQFDSGILLMRKGKITFRIVSENTDVNLEIEEIVKTVKLV